MYGCFMGFYGDVCDKYCSICVIGCDRISGVCSKECLIGRYGEYCDKMCNVLCDNGC